MAEKKKTDILLAIFIVAIPVSVILMIVLKILLKIPMTVVVVVPVSLLFITIIYFIIKHRDWLFGRKEEEEQKLMSPSEAYRFAKEWFKKEWGITMDSIANNEHAYIYQKPIGEKHSETMIYTMYMKESGNNNYYYIVMKANNPDGCHFMKNETNPFKLKILEDGQATKIISPMSVQTITTENVLTGNKTTSTTITPPKEESEDEEEEEKPKPSTEKPENA